MKLSDIKRHLRPYSIVQRRKTTVNHAFASALAPSDDYDEKRVAEAMALLGQTDLNNLLCVLATSKSGTHWEPRDQGLDGGLVSSLRALL